MSQSTNPGPKGTGMKQTAPSAPSSSSAPTAKPKAPKAPKAEVLKPKDAKEEPAKEQPAKEKAAKSKPVKEKPVKVQKVQAPNYGLPPTMFKACVLKVNDSLFGGKGLGVATDIDTSLLALRTPDVDSYLALVVDLPLPTSSEDNGFGKCHMMNGETQKVTPCDIRRFRVKFPREQIEIAYRAASQEEAAAYPKVKAAMTWVDVTLGQDAKVSVEGFGMPYVNPGHPAEEWLRCPDSALVIGDLALLDVFQQRHFTFFVAYPDAPLKAQWSVASLAPKFDYGYGANHYWDMEKYMDQLQEIKGHQFKAAWSHDTDGSYVAAITQSLVQDIMWLHKDCLAMSDEIRRAYFVQMPAMLNRSTRYFVIVSMGREFWERFDKAWSRLSKGSKMELVIHGEQDELPDKWKARIRDRPEFIDALSQHPLEATDLVLEAIKPKLSGTDIKEFETRDQASTALAMKETWDLGLHDVERKVEGVCQLLPTAAPTNDHFGCQSKEDAKSSSEQEKLVMSIHRDLLRGDGFYNTMVQSAPSAADIESGMKELGLTQQGKRMRLQTLPSVNFLDGPDAEWVDALMMEALEDDRQRFRRHLSQCPLGLVLITAGPGFGKTTAASAVIVAMNASVGKVLASGPTHVAVDNLCARTYAVSCRVTDRFNGTKEQGSRQRRALVVRGFKAQDELAAFKKLIENPDLGDTAAPIGTWGVQSKWKLQLSVSFWLLVCLGSSAVPALHDDDSETLHSLRTSLAARKDLARLRDRVAGNITWEEYANSETLSKGEFEKLLKRIVEAADIVCTLPSLAHTEDHLSNWRTKSARAIAIDEAGNMNRGDLCSIWGNTLLPCLLAGDEKQLAPVVTTFEDIDASGNSINRFGPDGKISALEFIKGTGWPVYRLRTQLRMAKGQFEICRTTVYSDVDCTYGPGSAVDLPAHHLGHVLEEYIRAKYPSVKPAAAGTLEPVFIDCKNSFCIVDPITKSKKNFDQIRAALDFCADFVKTKQVNPADVLIISPYGAMVEIIPSWMKKYEALKGMRPPSTIDSIQGQEATMVVVITGTNRAVGAGFTCDERRLNVMLSRHKSALVIFSEIDTVDYKGKGAGKAEVTEGPTGELVFTKATMLKGVHKRLVDSGRVAVVDCRPGDGKGKGKDKDKGKGKAKGKDKGKGKEEPKGDN
ncbi:hypothetical protein ACHAQI_001423 [Fusarium lateritium]